MLKDSQSEKQLNELFEEINLAILPHLEKLFGKGKHDEKAQKKFKKDIDRLEECVNYLRVLIKYQQFDIEASQREKAYLEKILKDKS
jgi:hypothetical protein